MQGENYTNVNFSSRFKDLLESSGKTQREVAAELGISEGAIVNYKKSRLPKAEELLRIAQFFGCSMEWLLTGGDDNKPKSQDGWKQRALAAEHTLNALKAAMTSWIEKI